MLCNSLQLNQRDNFTYSGVFANWKNSKRTQCLLAIHCSLKNSRECSVNFTVFALVLFLMKGKASAKQSWTKTIWINLDICVGKWSLWNHRKKYDNSETLTVFQNYHIILYYIILYHIISEQNTERVGEVSLPIRCRKQAFIETFIVWRVSLFMINECAATLSSGPFD